MAETVSVPDIYKILSQVKHPEHEARNLVELEMIHKQVDIKNNHILIDVALPFPNLPIKGQLD